MLLKRIRTGASRKSRRSGFVPSFFLLAVLLSQFSSVSSAAAKGRWTELNIGSFYVDSEGDAAQSRDILTQLEQLRWVLGGLLESKDLPSVWPIRIILTRNEKTNPTSGNEPKFVWQNAQYLLVVPDSHIPLDQVAGIFLDANTPLLSPEVESGIRQLFSTLQARGSRVEWGAPPPHPDLAWARMQLFATKFDYGASFHIFLTALKGGSDMAAAERNAFGKSGAVLEAEAAANLQASQWQAVPVSGRPLDPKRDFGEHSIEDVIADVYLADSRLPKDPKSAAPAYQAAVAAGGAAATLGYEGLAAVAKLDDQDPKSFLDDAIRAGSRSAPVYVAAAEELPDDEALPLLKTAARINPLWAEPIYRQVELTTDPAAKEALLKKATQLDPRATRYWIELAQVETTRGEATAAQGAWLRAEDSTPEGPERDRVHKMRVDSEQERLDAAEAAERRDRESVHLADQQAQQSEADRIRAVEQRANAALDAEAGGKAPSDAVAWNSLEGDKKLVGRLIRVDCLPKGQRLSIKDKSGVVTELYLEDSHPKLACGVSASPRRISVAYHALPDDSRHTAGEITEFQVQ